MEMRVFKAKQRVTPRFMIESDMGTDTLPIVIESGKEEDRDLDFVPEDIIIASTFFLLSLT